MKILSEIISELESGSRPKGGVTSEGEIPSLGAEHLDSDGGFTFKNVKRVSREFYNSLTSGKLSNADILIVKDGATTGKISFLSADFPFIEASINEHVFRIKIDENLAFPKYVFHFLKSDIGNRQIMRDFRGATVGGISRKFIDGVTIPLPELPEQQCIATILDHADSIRRKNRQILEKYNELAQSVFYEMFGDPEKNQYKFPVGTIRDLVSEVKYGTSNKSSDKGSYPYLRMNNLTYDGNMDFTEMKYVDIKDDEKAKYIVQNGDILFNRTNSKELVGKTAVYKKHEEMVIAGYLIRVRVNQKANSIYISAYLNSKHGKTTLIGMCKSIIGMANINAQEMQNIKILIPPVNLQNRFAEIVDRIEEQKKLTQKSFSKSEELFQSLLQRAFKGEL
ncbi:MAG: restriction endonuclease subunit S [Bacteroidota bacterium]